MHVFSADSICRSFGGRAVLKSASIWASAGRITVLFGRNGCGKSTLLRIGVGLLRADQGAVHFDGRVFVAPRLHDLARRGLFYLPDRDLLSRSVSLREQFRAIQWSFGGDRLDSAVARLGLGELLDRVPPELSGGERRRAEIAAAVIRAPRCLLADEPFTGITPKDAGIIAEVFREMAHEGCAVVVTGHEVHTLFEVADEIVWMAGGTTHWLGTPEQARRHEQFRREYLGPGFD